MSTPANTALFDLPVPQLPDLAAADIILVNSSAGKDSQAMLDYVVEVADAAGVRDRIVVGHCALGRVEWPGTLELAREQAEHYGVRFEAVHREQGDLLEQIDDRQAKLRARPDDDGKAPAWPSSQARYCTSDQKRAPVRKLITRLVAELGLDCQARVLNCLGLRAEESSGRARKPVLEVDKAATSGVREVMTWLPILDWSQDRVWARIAASGVRHHWAYDEGMRRLSCCFCVLATRDDLVCAARLMPELAAEYVEREQRFGHTFKADLSMADVVREARMAVSA